MASVVAARKQLGPSETERSDLAATARFARRVAKLLVNEASVVRWLLVASIVQAVLRLLPPWLAAKAIDEALPARAPRLLLTLVVFLIVTAVGIEAAGWLHDKVSVVFLQRLEALSLEHTLRRFLGRSFQQIEQRTFGEASEAMLTAARVTALFTSVLLTGVTSSFTAAVALVFLISWFPWLGVAVAAASSLTALSTAAYWPAETRLASEALSASCLQQQALHVQLKSLPSLRIANATQRALTDWRALLAAQARAVAEQGRLSLSRQVVLSGIPQLATVGAIAWLAYAILQGNAGLGQMLMALALIAVVVRAFATLVGLASAVQAQGPYLRQLDELAFGDETATSSPALHAGLRPQRDLVLDRVWYRYPRADAENWALAGVSLRIPEGELTLVSGASGTGKTTQLRLLAGLLEPQRGQVSVLGRAPLEMRDSITYLPQQAVLLQASIADNLKILSAQSLQACLEIARHTGLEAWLRELPMGVETLVSSGGGNLSAGQRQLVLLTAAFAAGRPVVLLDEPTSQIDAATKRRINWPALVRGKTVLMVSHDESQSTGVSDEY